MCHRHYKSSYCSQACADEIAHESSDEADDTSEQLENEFPQLLPPTEHLAEAPLQPVRIQADLEPSPVDKENRNRKENDQQEPLPIPVDLDHRANIGAAYDEPTRAIAMAPMPNSTPASFTGPEGAMAMLTASDLAIVVTTELEEVDQNSAADSNPLNAIMDMDTRYSASSNMTETADDYQYRFDCSGPKPQHRLHYLHSLNVNSQRVMCFMHDSLVGIEVYKYMPFLRGKEIHCHAIVCSPLLDRRWEERNSPRTRF